MVRRDVPDWSRSAHDAAMAAITAAVHGDPAEAVTILESSPELLVTCGSLLGAVLLVLASGGEQMEERWQAIATQHMVAAEQA